MSHPQRPEFATLVRAFFCDRLQGQQNVSPHTIAAYRDTVRLLFVFLKKHRRVSVEALTFDHLDTATVLAFLDYLERDRGNSIRTRNARLTALRAFVTYAASRNPEVLPITQRLRAIPRKRYDRPLLGFLTRDEIDAVLNAPDRNTWNGRRDRALFTLMYNTGARVSEAVAWRRGEVTMGPTATIRIHGKGRKDRMVPLWKATAQVLTNWLAEISDDERTPLFPNRHGEALSRSGVEERLQRAVEIAADRCPTLWKKNVSPHTLRHTTAMHLLQAGVDVTVIALWLGHESTETTHQYIEADVEMKRQVLDRLKEPSVETRSPRPSKDLQEFLDNL